MGMESTHVVTCDARVAEDCRRTESVTRQYDPNDRRPEFVVPPGWTQSKAGLACPECTAVQA